MAKILLLLSQWIIDRVQNTLLALKNVSKASILPTSCGWEWKVLLFHDSFMKFMKELIEWSTRPNVFYQKMFWKISLNSQQSTCDKKN